MGFRGFAPLPGDTACPHLRTLEPWAAIIFNARRPNRMALSLHYNGSWITGGYMLRRTAFTLLTVLTLAAGRAEAVTIRDVIELSKAGLSEQVLLALIEVDRSVF